MMRVPTDVADELRRRQQELKDEQNLDVPLASILRSLVLPGPERAS